MFSPNYSDACCRLVIMILVDVANGKQRHVPYRDSKLTFLLQVLLRCYFKKILGFCEDIDLDMEVIVKCSDGSGMEVQILHQAYCVSFTTGGIYHWLVCNCRIL